MSTPRKILVVDDDELIREKLHAVFETLGHAVTSVDRPLGVSRVMRNEAPDLVLIDVSMPALSGDQLVRLLKKQNPESKILLYSSHPDDELSRRTHACGADGYLRKDLPDTELIARVTEWLGR